VTSIVELLHLLVCTKTIVMEMRLRAGRNLTNAIEYSALNWSKKARHAIQYSLGVRMHGLRCMGLILTTTSGILVHIQHSAAIMANTQQTPSYIITGMMISSRRCERILVFNAPQ
jgi:hypothetical protein